MPSKQSAVWILAGLLAPAFLIAAKEGERLSPGKRDFCRIVYGCGLDQPPGYCPDRKELGKFSFTFDSVRCLEARTLQGRGIGPSHPVVGFQLYRFLGMEYRVIYPLADTLPVSLEKLEYLLADLPLAARLVSHYRKEPYTAQYTDPAHTHFTGAKGKKLRGDARLISGSLQENRLFYFGLGTAEIAFWTLRGPALMDFIYAPASGKGPRVEYRMKLLVFPGNGFVNTIMNLGLFRKMVVKKVREVLVDITDTARQLAETGGKDLLQDPKWNPEEKRKIEAFLKLP